MAPRSQAISIDANTAEGPHAAPSGGTGTGVYGGRVEDLDPNAEVKGELWYGNPSSIGLGQQMMRDAVVRWGVAGWTAPVIAATWDFEPASDDPAEVEAADYQYYNWLERNDFVGFITRSSTGYTRDGSSVHELTDDVAAIPQSRFPLHPGKGLGTLYTGFHHRPRYAIDSWIQSKTNSAQIAGFKQYIKGADAEKPGYRDVRFDEGDLFIRMTWDQEGSNFDGFPQSRSAWSPFKRKRIYQVLGAVKHERSSVPVPCLEEPDNSVAIEEGERNTADEIAKDLRSHEQAFLRLPAGWKFSWVAPNTVDSGLGRSEEACDFEILFNFGLGWMKLGSNGSKNGSYALGDVQSSFGLLTSKRQATFIEYALNVGHDGFSPVMRSHLANYGSKVGCPRAVVRYMPIGDPSGLLAALPALIQAGIVRLDDTLEHWVRVMIGCGPHDPKTARTAPAPSSSPAPAPKQEAST